MNGWQPIETAPEEEDILICKLYDDGSSRIEIAQREGEDWYALHDIVMADPTHWMPLPTPPRQQSDKSGRPYTEDEWRRFLAMLSDAKNRFIARL
jgi:hypothetical protein